MAKIIKKTNESKDGKYKFDNWIDDETGERGVDVEYTRQDGTKRRNELERKKKK